MLGLGTLGWIIGLAVIVLALVLIFIPEPLTTGTGIMLLPLGVWLLVGGTALTGVISFVQDNLSDPLYLALFGGAFLLIVMLVVMMRRK